MTNEQLINRLKIIYEQAVKVLPKAYKEAMDFDFGKDGIYEEIPNSPGCYKTRLNPKHLRQENLKIKKKLIYGRF